MIFFRLKLSFPNAAQLMCTLLVISGVWFSLLSLNVQIYVFAYIFYLLALSSSRFASFSLSLVLPPAMLALVAASFSLVH